MLGICKKLFYGWNDANIQYCHWKSNEHLMEGLDGETDLDVFVMPEDRAKAELLLEQYQYIKFVPQKSARYPLVDEWIGFDYDTGNLVHMHLHYQIITGTKYNKEYVFPLNDQMIVDRILDVETNVYVASPNWEIILLYSRIALKSKDKKNIQPKKDDQKEIDYLKERLDKDAFLNNCKACFGEHADFVYESILSEKLSTSEWLEVFKVVKKWLAPYRKYSAVHVKFRYFYHYYRNVAMAVSKAKMGKHPIMRKTLPNKRLSVCFIGADGSGKSTVSCEIQKWLTWKVEADRFYLGSGDHYNSLTKRLLSKFTKKASSKTSASKEKNENKQPKQNPTPKKVPLKQRVLRWGYGVLSYSYLRKIAVRSYKEIKKAQKYVKKGAIALFDRFPQNQFAGLYDGPKIRSRTINQKSLYARMMARSEERAIQKAQKYQPTLVFKLILTPEESVRRKPDHTLEEVAPKANITPQLKFEKSKVVDVDAAQPYDLEILQIKRIIWEEVTSK